MTITINAQGAERKRLVQTISDWLGVPAKYCGAPIFNYEVDYFTIDRNGNLSFDDRTDSEVIERLLQHICDEGFATAMMTRRSSVPSAFPCRRVCSATEAGMLNLPMRTHSWQRSFCSTARTGKKTKFQSNGSERGCCSLYGRSHRFRWRLFFYALEVSITRKLKTYKPTRFMEKTSHYDVDAADYAVMFIESLCHTKGTWARQPFELIDWQEQIIRDIFGVLKSNGYRQFNTAYIEIPKKQGKSELAAAVALLLTCGDGEERAEVYGCAADRQQASIVFNVAADMVRMCPALSKRVKILDSQKRLIYQPTGSIYQVLSADIGNKHGFNTHGVVFDELHTQPNRKLFDVMTKGSGDARMQPLYFLITTAGNDTKSICYEIHQKPKDIIEGRKIDHTFYPVIYGADESDDWTDPKVWKKANPSLGITVGIDKVKDACESAKQNPGEENSFRQLRLNQWVKQAIRWMPMDKWDKCEFAVSEDDLEGRICYGGLDLSSTTDITAFVLVFPPEDETDKYIILPYFWIPEDNLDLRVRRDHVPYDVWERQGYLQTTEGNVVHYGYIEKFIESLGERFNIREIAFDRWGAVQMVQNLEGMGFTVVPFGQGFKDMSPPTKELMKLTLEEKVAHSGHPVLRWMMDNIYVRTDPAGNIKPDKEKSTEKIDGAVAMIMALDRAIRCGNDTSESVYDERGILFV